MVEAVHATTVLVAEKVEPVLTATVPEPYRQLLEGRTRRRLGDALGLSQFGINRVELAPGGRSSFRHWHTREDEFVYGLQGELVLVTEDGETPISAGMCAGFPCGAANAHCLVNQGSQVAVYLEVGTRNPDDICVYPDDDVKHVIDGEGFHVLHKDGRPY